MGYYLKTLGQLSIHDDGPERPALLSASKSLAVLAYLSTHSSTPVSRSRIARLFWPGADRPRARQSLRQALYYLSRKVGEKLVDSTRRELTVRSDLLDVDLWAFERALEREEYERTLELYDGPFLAGVEEKLGRELETWVEARNERIWTGVQAALHRLVLQSLTDGDPERAIHFSRRYVELNPFQEEAQLALVRSLVAAERPVAAIQAYESYRSLLREQLEDEPGQELRTYVEELRGRVFQTPELDSTPPDLFEKNPPRRAGAATASAGAPDAEAPSSRPSTDDGGARGSLKDAWRPLLSASAVLVLLSILLQGGIPSGAGNDRLLPATAWARAATSGLPGRTFHLVPHGDSLGLNPTELGSRDLSPPGGGAPVGQVRTPRGYDLALLDEDGQADRILTRRPHDETPLAWSPDGRHLVFRDGVMGPDGVHYRRRLAILELSSGAVRSLPDLQTRAHGRAAWAPSGAWIVFGARSEEGDHEVFRVRPDGSDLENLSRSPGFDGDPAWSPDGRWIAFVSERSGSRSIHLLDPANGRIVHRVESGFDEHQPVWLGSDRILYLSTRAGETDVWMYDLEHEERRRLTHRGDFRLLEPASDVGASPWIEELRIHPRQSRVAPGQWLRLAVDGFGPSGRPVPVPERMVSWSSSDEGSSSRSVLRKESEGLFRVEAVGDARITASIPGWRSIDLELQARSPRIRRPRPLFQEAWADGIEDRRWARYGDPVPEVVERDGRFGRTFRNNGDAHFDSGVASRTRFSIREGATLEVWARLPLQERHYQGLTLALVADPAPPGTVAWSAPGSTPLRVGLRGDPEGIQLTGFQSDARIPPPDSLDRWRRYALQVDERGVPSFLVDGDFHWRGEPIPEETLTDSVHIVLAGRTVETDVLVGPVTLFQGSRYTLR